MVEIECLVCGKNIKIPKYIDNEKFDGQIVCKECESLLHLRLVKGKVQKYKIIIDKSESEPVQTFVFQMPDGTRVTPGKLAKTQETEGEVKESRDINARNQNH